MICFDKITEIYSIVDEFCKDFGFLKAVFGKLFADKGYISKKLQEILFIDGIQLITSVKNNMKNSLMTLSDKILLRKRSVIETVNDELKNICQIEHSRHRSFANFVTNLLAGIMAYSFLPKKPYIKYETENLTSYRCFINRAQVFKLLNSDYLGNRTHVNILIS